MRIDANVVKAVQELLISRGIEQKPNERMGDYIARGLGISDAKAYAFLEYLQDGAPVDEAKARAGIEIGDTGNALLIDIARAIGFGSGPDVSLNKAQAVETGLSHTEFQLTLCRSSGDLRVMTPSHAIRCRGRPRA